MRIFCMNFAITFSTKILGAVILLSQHFPNIYISYILYILKAQEVTIVSNYKIYILLRSGILLHQVS